jgi:transposase
VSLHYNSIQLAYGYISGCRIIYLPPYSPDLNPIEQLFSSLKSRIRRRHSIILDALSGNIPGLDPYALLWEAVYDTKPEMVLGWYKHSGYIA